jgi:hypothetical protein
LFELATPHPSILFINLKKRGGCFALLAKKYLLFVREVLLEILLINLKDSRGRGEMPLAFSQSSN